MIGYLASYAYFKTKDMREFQGRLGHEPIFADSGAFSAHNVGVSVHVNNYARWLWKWHDVFDVTVNLDVIGSEKGSAKNLAILRGFGLNPTPVFHLGVPVESIMREVDNGANYIALGGLVVKTDRTRVLNWIDSVFTAVGQDVNVHGFGFTKIQHMTQFPWKSVDSSSWLAGARYNQMVLFDEPDFVRVDLSDPVSRHNGLRLIGEHGGDIARFASGKFHYKDTFALGAIAMYRASEYWAREAARRGWKEPVLYLASTDYHLLHARRAIRSYQRQHVA